MESNNNEKVFRALTQQELDQFDQKLERIEKRLDDLSCGEHGERIARVEVKTVVVLGIVTVLVVKAISAWVGS